MSQCRSRCNKKESLTTLAKPTLCFLRLNATPAATKRIFYHGDGHEIKGEVSMPLPQQQKESLMARTSQGTAVSQCHSRSNKKNQKVKKWEIHQAVSMPLPQQQKESIQKRWILWIIAGGLNATPAATKRILYL